MRLKILGLFLSVLMLSGCATLMLEEYGSTGGYKSKQKALGAERIVAFTRPAASPACDADCQKKLVMVSKQHAYVLDKGIGDAGMLELIGTALEVKRLRVVGGGQGPSALTVYVGRDSGRFVLPIVMHYEASPGQAFSSEERAALAELVKQHQWVKVGERHYRSEYRLEGAMYPPVKNLDEVLGHHSVQGLYEIQVVETYSGRSLNTKGVLKPFAVVFDVVTAPIQLMGVILGAGVFEGFSGL